MYVAGVSMEPSLVRDLIARIHEAGGTRLAMRLGHSVDHGQSHVALTIDERVALLAALDDPPPGLEQLRAVLLQEHVGRLRDGLV